MRGWHVDFAQWRSVGTRANLSRFSRNVLFVVIMRHNLHGYVTWYMIHGHDLWTVLDIYFQEQPNPVQFWRSGIICCKGEKRITLAIVNIVSLSLDAPNYRGEPGSTIGQNLFQNWTEKCFWSSGESLMFLLTSTRLQWVHSGGGVCTQPIYVQLNVYTDHSIDKFSMTYIKFAKTI